ncbi:hypothetical protein PGC35_19385 [Psychrobacillus sp. PGGUH221]|uniref:hypothetical protein n=1 Tax=Psychrobacillus sp. PGGUH221 TaxID=3020058 RepID=UPI0035C6C0D5
MHEIKILVRGIELDIVKNNVCHYLLWRKICEGIGTVKGIDNGIRRKPDYNDDIKTAAKYFNSIINSIYNILKNEEINLEDISNFILQVFSVFVFFTNDFLINTIHKNHFNHNVLNEINIVLIINKETNLCCVLGMNKKD